MKKQKTPQHLWHHLPTDALSLHLDVDGTRGLSENEATRRRDSIGPNCLTPKKGKNAIVVIYAHPLEKVKVRRHYCLVTRDADPDKLGPLRVPEKTSLMSVIASL